MFNSGACSSFALAIATDQYSWKEDLILTKPYCHICSPISQVVMCVANMSVMRDLTLQVFHAAVTMTSDYRGQILKEQ